MKPIDFRISPDGRERRFVGTTVELRASKRGDAIGLITGYAARYNQSSCDLGGFFERIAAGAFRAVMDDDVVCLFNHRDECILGRSTSGTLRLREDDDGLAYDDDLPDTGWGRDTRVSVGRKDITGCSFAFTVADDGESWDFNGRVAVRTIHKFARLYDVGPVTHPAYDSTEVNARSLETARERRLILPGNPVSVSLSLAQARLRLATASPFEGE